MTREELLAEVEDLIRTTPPRPTIRHETAENTEWFGRAAALISAWSPERAGQFNRNYEQALDRNAHVAAPGLRLVFTMIQEMRSNLVLQTRGPLSTVVGKGMVFDYFDELRKIIESSREDLLFIDPYMDADFVSRYLPHVVSGVAVRLLGRERISTLLPAATAFAQQSGVQVQVRTASGFHDRYVIVDHAQCYQSGASFKDGGRAAPTTLTQIIDAFAAVQTTYEGLWSGAVTPP